MKHIYISPHSDDVALSCGGQIIADAGRRAETLILNIFTSDPQCDDMPPSESSGSFGTAINSQRTAEDSAAWASVGVEADYVRYPEALLRKKFPFTFRASPRPDDVTDALCKTLVGYINSYPEARFYFPAGIGNHIDHVACRQVGFRLLKQGALSSITLYEDVPYAWLRFIRSQFYRALRRDVALQDLRDTRRRDGLSILQYLAPGAVPFPNGRRLFTLVYAALAAAGQTARLARAAQPYSGRLISVQLDDDLVQKKKALLYHYASQIPMLFGPDPERVLARLGESLSREIAVEISQKPARTLA